MKTPDRIKIVSNGPLYRIKMGELKEVEQTPRIVEKEYFFGLTTRLKLEKWSKFEWIWTVHSKFEYRPYLTEIYRETPFDFKSYNDAKNWIVKEFGDSGIRALKSHQDEEWIQVNK